jgi:excisionase family DNA binding protein
MAGSERLLNASEAAEFLGVSTSSVRKWSDQGLVPVYRTPGGQRRYSLTDLERFLESMREPPRGDLRAADMPPRARRPGSAKGG